MNSAKTLLGMASPKLEELIVTARNPETKEFDRFQGALRQIGRMLSYELSKTLDTKDTRVTTVMGKDALHYTPAEAPVLIAILRAGLPLYEGGREIFNSSEAGFLGSMRDEETLKPKTTYIALPDLKGKIAIIYDTMLATGGSMEEAIDIAFKRGAREVYVCSAIASTQGIARIEKAIPRDHIYAASIDDELNNKGYIVPGLGDAGDRSFGKKLD